LAETNEQEMDDAHTLLIGDLKNAIKNWTPEKLTEALQRISLLYLSGAELFSDDQVNVFDDVLCLLGTHVPSQGRTELSMQLALFDKAPVGVVRQLAQDHDISVAKPILAGSTRLTAGDLREIAQTANQDRLGAISSRTDIEEPLTDLILQLAAQKVLCILARNDGARFSESGFAILADRAERDDELAAYVGARNDLPDKLLRERNTRKTGRARKTLPSAAPLGPATEMHAIAASAADTRFNQIAAPRLYLAAAETFIAKLTRQGQLIGAAVLAVARKPT
jgi:uncharacterized protein (DUF2336 family)